MEKEELAKVLDNNGSTASAEGGVAIVPGSEDKPTSLVGSIFYVDGGAIKRRLVCLEDTDAEVVLHPSDHAGLRRDITMRILRPLLPETVAGGKYLASFVPIEMAPKSRRRASSK